MNYKVLYLALFISSYLSTHAQLSTPIAIKATKGTYEKTIRVTWNGSNTGFYKIYKGTSPKLSAMKPFKVPIKGNQPKEFFDTGKLLYPGKKFYYAIKHVINNQESPFSKIAMGFTAPATFAETPIPKFPLDHTEFSPENLIDFQWSAVADAITYEIQISQDSSNWTLNSGFMDNNVLKNRISDTIFSKLGEELGNGTYYWTVKAILGDDSTLHSYFSEPISFVVEGELLGSNDLPDVAPTKLTLPKSLKLNATVPFSLTLNSKYKKNIGTYKIAFVLSKDDKYQLEGEGDILLKTVSKPITGLGKYEIKGNFKIPSTIKKGNLQLLCIPIIDEEFIHQNTLVTPVVIE